jgi:GDP-4-dehydro-6-deoxy-D-mannose reductase
VRALVTGGHGFVGRWLVSHLEEQGADVTATGEEVDVTDADKVRDFVADLAPDAVFHLAGQASVGRSWDAPSRTFAVNALGTLHVLDAARRLAPAPRVLVVSSAEVYGAVTPDELPLREDTPPRPVSPYAASKAAAEVIAQQAARGYGLRVVIARPFNHIGPGQSPAFVVAALAKRIVDAQRDGATKIEMGNPTARRDLTDVRDVVRAYALLIDHGEPGEVYNVATGQDVRIGDLAEMLVAAAGGGIEVVTDAVDARPADVPVLRGDPSKLRAATGWTPQVPLEQTLGDVLEAARHAR